MTRAIKILEKEIEIIRWSIDNPYVDEDYAEKISKYIPEIQKAIDYLKKYQG